MHILVTAFEPFGGAETNISQAVLEGICADVRKALLPVSFRNAPIVLQQAIRDIHPDVILMLGQCKEESQMRLERFAVNLMDSAKGDNDGYYPQEETIYTDSPTAYLTPFSVRALVDVLAAQDFPIRASNSAGLYVCNRVYYEALHLGQKALFAHIPKSLPLTLAAQTIEQLLTLISNNTYS